MINVLFQFARLRASSMCICVCFDSIYSEYPDDSNEEKYVFKLVREKPGRCQYDKILNAASEWRKIDFDLNSKRQMTILNKLRNIQHYYSLL